MNEPAQTRSRWVRRGLVTVGLVLGLLGGLRVAHWGALKYVDSLAPQPAFPEIRLRRGLSERDVVSALGAAPTRLRHAAMDGEPAEETLRYVRGQCTLELTFRDGTLDRWTETQPGEVAMLKFGRLLPSECCEPQEEQDPQDPQELQDPSGAD